MSEDALAPVDPADIRLSDLFLGFLEIGLYGFGGVGAVSRYVVVEKRRWMTGKDYLALLAVGQVLPGGNVINASIMVGDRFRGVPGAISALAGLVTVPLAILAVLGILSDRFGGTAAFQAVAFGGGAAAAGLVIGTGLRLARPLKPDIFNLAIGGAGVVALGVLQVPLPLVVVVLLPASIGWALWRTKK